MLKKYSFLFVLLITLQVSSAWSDFNNTISNALPVQRKKGIKFPVKKHHPLDDYPYNPHVSLETWDSLKPYFLPYNSPLRINLDRIFQSERVILDRESVAAAGFKILRTQGTGSVCVAKHPLLEGCLVKIYPDNQVICEWENFFRRVTGAQSINQSINRHGFQKHFKVPKKWIYPLPMEPSPPDGDQYFRKNFILIVEDMNILSMKENAVAFKTQITPKILDEFYTIITEEGLFDSVFRGNIPFNKEGQMNFIDTEHHHGWPIKYHFLLRYLSPEMASYWQSITTTPG